MKFKALAKIDVIEQKYKPGSDGFIRFPVETRVLMAFNRSFYGFMNKPTCQGTGSGLTEKTG